MILSLTERGSSHVERVRKGNEAVEAASVRDSKVASAISAHSYYPSLFSLMIL